MGLPDENRTVILIAPGFDLPQVTHWTSTLRKAGCSVWIVGLTPGTVRSRDGVRLLPDCDLDLIMKGGTPGLVLLPGGRECEAGLARDPRVERWLQEVEGAGMIVGGVPAFQEALPGVGIRPLPLELERCGVRLDT